MNLGSKGMSGRPLQYFTRHMSSDLESDGQWKTMRNRRLVCLVRTSRSSNTYRLSFGRLGLSFLSLGALWITGAIVESRLTNGLID